MKTRKQFVALALIAIIGIAVIGCKEDDPPAPETFTVTFDANGGSPTPEPQPVEKGATAEEPPAPTKANNTLEGWYKEEALTTKWIFATDTVTANITLWAKWVLVETAFRDYTDQVMFAEGTTNYKADITDARTGERSKTLEELGIVAQLQSAITEAYKNADFFDTFQFTNVFDSGNNTKGKVKITIENVATNTSYKVVDSANLKFDIAYLLDEETTDAVLQAAIATAVADMNSKIGSD